MIRKISLFFLLIIACQFALADKAFDDLLVKAKAGDAEAQYRLGYMYYIGGNVKRDDVKSFSWFSKAANQGHLGAQNNLGVMYNSGRGVAQDYTQSAAWIIKAAERGWADAQDNLGRLYFYGEGLGKNDKAIIAWWSKAAEQGDYEAQNSLAGMYYRGDGVTKDHKRAMDIYIASAMHGCKYGQSNLGSIYRDDIKDYKKSYIWFTIAAKTWNRTFEGDLASVTELLTSTDLEEAKIEIIDIQKKIEENKNKKFP